MSTTGKNLGGRPPKYKSADEITGLIDAYFEKCDGTPLLGDDGQPLVDKWGNPIILGSHPYTVTGLALALGFTTRQSLLNYQGKKEFRAVIEAAKTKIEMYAEERLFDKDGANGAKFSLQNNFRGWNDAAKEAAAAGAAAVKIVCDIPRPVAPPGESDNADTE